MNIAPVRRAVTISPNQEQRQLRAPQNCLSYTPVYKPIQTAAAVAGRAGAGQVLMHTASGSHRVVDVLMGELLPRIC